VDAAAWASRTRKLSSRAAKLESPLPVATRTSFTLGWLFNLVLTTQSMSSSLV
jgi:hypothetical protein